LPQDVIELLAGVDPDLSRAVVRLAMPLSHIPPDTARAEVAASGNRAVIIVPPDKALAALPGVELLPLADGRCLIALEAAGDAAALELALWDHLDAGTLPPESSALFAEVARVLREARRTSSVHLRRIIVLRQPGR